MKQSTLWLFGWVLVLVLAACGQGGVNPANSSVGAQRLTGTLELQVGYDFDPNLEGTANGKLDKGEQLIGNWPVQITELDDKGSPVDKPVVVQSLEKGPLQLELPEGRYQVAFARPDPLKDELFWEQVGGRTLELQVTYKFINRVTGMMLCRRSGSEVHVFDYGKVCVLGFAQPDRFPPPPPSVPSGSVRCTVGVGDNAADLVTQPDSKILLLWHQSNGWRVARYNPDCTLDTTFGRRGQVSITPRLFDGTTYQPLAEGFNTQMAVGPGGKISILSRMDDGTNRCGNGGDPVACSVWARLNPDGTMDSSFGGQGLAQGQRGIAIIPARKENRYYFPVDYSAPNAVDMIQRADGRYLIGGFIPFRGTRFLYGYGSDGSSLAGSWDISGPLPGLTIGTGRSNSAPEALIRLAGDGVAFTGGNVYDFGLSGESLLYLVKLDANLQEVWVRRRDFDPSNQTLQNYGGTDVAVQSNGALVVGGYQDEQNSNGNWTGRDFLLRYFADGSEDRAFGLRFVQPNQSNVIFGKTGEFRRIEVQPDDKIVTAGLLADGTVVLQRFSPEGMPDTTFGTGGVVTGKPGWVSGLEVAVVPNGEIVTYMWSRHLASQPSRLTIYNP